ncbi:MAG: NAD(P)/FAD-dependent oxidoreductase [Pikeienuella sp.]
MQDYDVIIIGAGAAGMMCAAEATRRGRKVLLIEHAKKPGEKIRISGGGRCNFTNLDIRAEAYLGKNPRFALSALKRYTQWDFIAMVEAHGIAWHEKTLGQLFCDESAQQIIDMLRSEMASTGRAGTDLKLSCAVETVHAVAGGYQVKTNGGTFAARSLVIATGGKSIPKMGATGWAYQVAQQFGLRVTETRAGLVPFTLDPDRLQVFAPLRGVAAPVTAVAGGAQFEEAMLFTHRGLSGPAMLQISSYWREGEAISVAFDDADALFGHLKAARAVNGRRAPATALAERLPKAIATLLASENDATGNLADMSDKRLAALASHAAQWKLTPLGTEGYRTAEVTLGGVDTDDLDAKTMASRTHPGLYFIGEAVDITGWLGGYNFQWAWSSGWAAGQVV